jgi:transcriptional regulator with XRE-family HTH domain
MAVCAMSANQPSFAAMIAGLESRGLSRADIAKKTGISKTTIWRLANNANADHLSGTVTRMERLSRSYKNPPVERK